MKESPRLLAGRSPSPHLTCHGKILLQEWEKQAKPMYQLMTLEKRIPTEEICPVTTVQFKVIK
jgi:hypothetical protein